MRAAPSRYTLTIPLRGDRMLAYNSASQHFALWDADDVAAWKMIDRGELAVTDAAASEFLQSRFAVFDGQDELAGIEREYMASRLSEQSLQITVCTTLYCNLACSYCFQGMVKPSTKMKAPVREAIVEYARQTVLPGGHLSVGWYGGEPLMGQEALFDLAARFDDLCEEKRASRSSFIITNGYLLTSKLARKLTETGVSIAQVTLDGPAAMHDERRPLLSGRGSYERILDNLCDVADNSTLPVSIRVNVDMTNCDAVYEMLADLSRRGLGLGKRLSVYFAPVEATTIDCASCHSSTLQKEAYAAFEIDVAREAARLGLALAPPGGKFMGLCQAVRPRSIVVTPTGDVHKCWETVNQPELRHGNIFDMAAANKSAVATRWAAWTPFDNDVCRECRILPMCAGACAFKTVHSDQQSGESSLPCPSWKFNVAERMFLRAEQKGLVTRGDWIDGISGTNRPTGRITGERQSTASVGNAAMRLDGIAAFEMA
ncbi:radical SAM/SPASM domain-containing protein [Sphingomonas qomolangmaensis]|uniref:SPASM domain-containing protein n=1 Tax=Sphingomonas qomolangmaensis TaxID=2918765 RepID=A0ABY5LAP4_9SPHN|nr:SPASM domain-containing protein [Sphingomonas qomolangmaensis]UUL84025.1 SPASM domain-containing protein [Sphingomonas qomolangmaensis]